MTAIRDSRTEKLVQFETFIDQYYPSIFAGVQKLCGPVDKLVLEKLTVEIFVELWDRHQELFRPLRKPAFIYKILVKHVIDYLKRQGNDAQLKLLHDTLLIDPEQSI